MGEALGGGSGVFDSLLVAPRLCKFPGGKRVCVCGGNFLLCTASCTRVIVCFCQFILNLPLSIFVLLQYHYYILLRVQCTGNLVGGWGVGGGGGGKRDCKVLCI